MTLVGQDLKCAFRILRKDKHFFTFAVLTLALCIGANTAVFGVVNAIILRDLPVREPWRLAGFYRVDRSGQSAGITVSQIQEIKRQQRVFTGVFGRIYPNNSNVDIEGTVWPINLGYVTGEYYSVLGVNPVLGRLITPDDVGLSGGAPSPVAVISYDFWRRRYAGDSHIIGHSVLIAKIPFTIIGVTPKGFFGEQVGFSLDVSIPVTEIPGRAAGSQPTLRCQYAVGRLREGVSLEQARAQLETIWQEVRAATVLPALTPQQRDDFLSQDLRVEPYPRNGFSYLRDQFSEPLYILTGISSLILLIGCVNLATLLLARASGRRQEMSIRLALGASPWRLIQQLLTESVLLSICGGALSLGLSYWASRWLVGFWSHIAFNPPTVIDTRPDIRVLGFAMAAALFTGILFGLAPAWYASHAAPAGAMQRASRASSSNVRRLGKIFVIAQVAFSLGLVTTGGLFVRSLEKLRAIRPGVDYRRVAVLQLGAKAGGQKSFDDDYYRSLVRQLSELPGVRSATLSQMLPGSGFGGSDIVGRTAAGSEAEIKSDSQIVSPGFFQTLGIAFQRGRDFTWEDSEHAPRVAIISKTLAEQLFPEGGGIDQRLRIGQDPERQNIKIVGVVNDARVRDIREASPFIVYVPFLQEPEYTRYWTNAELLVLAQPNEVLESAQRAVESLGRQYVFHSETLEQAIGTTIANERATAFVSGFLGILTLMLAGIGLYGLMSYRVTQRTAEIGIRMVLGAPRPAVLIMILQETLAITGVGLTLGLPCALTGTRIVSHLLFDLSPSDPTTVVGVAILLALVALLACSVPAWRAARVDPMTALRHE
jgi:predicted permease